MAGQNPDFDADEFRAAIRFAWNMAAAVDAAEQPVFVFPGAATSAGTLDADGVPFDPAATVTHDAETRVSVACGVEYFDNQGQGTNALGVLQPTRIVVTVFDEEYPQIEGCSYVEIDGDRYIYRRTEPPSGLFDAGLYRMHFAAEDET